MQRLCYDLITLLLSDDVLTVVVVSVPSALA
jgi:hypothetical protein